LGACRGDSRRSWQPRVRGGCRAWISSGGARRLVGRVGASATRSGRFAGSVAGPVNCFQAAACPLGQSGVSRRDFLIQNPFFQPFCRGHFGRCEIGRCSILEHRGSCCF
jgi:hypothetical protein